jgi:hypothetical protein
MNDQDNPVWTNRETQIEDVQRQIADLKGRWPAHSVPPAMIQQLDELEEELEQLRDESLQSPVD